MAPKTAASLRPGRVQRGFTLIEVMISMTVMTIGLVSLLGVFGLAMASTQGSEQNAIAKQLANEAVEGILTARETANVTWSQIANTGAGGIFLSGSQPIYLPGADGIIGTADDSAAGPRNLQMPGPDGIFGTADDVQLPMSNYRRTIAITPALDQAGNPISTLNSVTITIKYINPRISVPQLYVLSTYISQYR